MARLTQSIRESIVRKAIQASFAEREADMKAVENRLAIECYEAVIPEAERTLARQMPEAWLRMDSCLRFNANGWDVRLNCEPAVPVPHSGHCSRLGNLTGELADRVQEHSRTKDALRNSKNDASLELAGFLEQFRSLKQLREAWPEGAEFYKQYETEREAPGVPAVRVAKINTLLGLKEAA